MQQEYTQRMLKKFAGEIVNFGNLFGILVAIPPTTVSSPTESMVCDWAVIENCGGQHAVLFDSSVAYVTHEDDNTLTIMTEK